MPTCTSTALSSIDCGLRNELLPYILKTGCYKYIFALFCFSRLELREQDSGALL
jgi:hypothetical protein